MHTSGLVRVSPGTGDGQAHAEAFTGGEEEVLGQQSELSRQLVDPFV